jgi:hypothetical protein
MSASQVEAPALAGAKAGGSESLVAGYYRRVRGLTGTIVNFVTVCMGPLCNRRGSLVPLSAPSATALLLALVDGLNAVMLTTFSKSDGA